MAHKDSIISVRLENKDFDRLTEIATVSGISMSDVVREAIKFYTNRAHNSNTFSQDTLTFAA